MNKFAKIGCGCGLAVLLAIIIGIVWGLFYISKNQDKIISSIKIKANDAYNSMVGDGQEVIDEFFAKYNNKDFGYICNEMYDDSSIKSQNSCIDNLNQLYTAFGKELSYDISFPNAAINMHKSPSSTQYSIYFPVKFENFKNSYASFDMKSIGIQELKIYNVGFEINTSKNPYKF